MGNYKRGNQYWNTKHEDLCKAWLSATTEIQYTRIHNALRPTLNYMGELVLNRYFSVPNASQQAELKKDAVNFLFIRMKEFKPDKGTAYNFCGMILKRYFYDKLVLKQERLFSMDGKVDYMDELPENAIPIEYYQSEEIDYEKVLDFFKKLKYKLKLEMKLALKANPRREPKVLKRYLVCTTYTIEYIEKYHDFSPANIADYIFTHSKYTDKSTIIYFFKKMTNLRIGNRCGIDFQGSDKGNVVDDRYDYILDDYTPDENKFGKRSNIKSLKKKYENYDLYRYF